MDCPNVTCPCEVPSWKGPIQTMIGDLSLLEFLGIAGEIILFCTFVTHVVVRPHYFVLRITLYFVVFVEHFKTFSNFQNTRINLQRAADEQYDRRYDKSEIERKRDEIAKEEKGDS